MTVARRSRWYRVVLFCAIGLLFGLFFASSWMGCRYRVSKRTCVRCSSVRVQRLRRSASTCFAGLGTIVASPQTVFQAFLVVAKVHLQGLQQGLGGGSIRSTIRRSSRSIADTVGARRIAIRSSFLLSSSLVEAVGAALSGGGEDGIASCYSRIQRRTR